MEEKDGGGGTQDRKGKEEGKGRCVKEGTTKGKGAGKKGTKGQGRSGGSIFCVCWVVSDGCIIVHTTTLHTGQGRKQWADGDTYQKVASSERVCSCFLVCVRPRGEVLVRFW